MPAHVSEYARMWNTAEFERIRDLAHPNFAFRGALGSESLGHESFITYARSIHDALADYRCDVLTCVCDDERAFAKMRYRGRHVRPFLGFAATGLPVEWHGAALFNFAQGRIAELWVLGDRHGLERQLQRNKALVV